MEPGHTFTIEPMVYNNNNEIIKKILYYYNYCYCCYNQICLGTNKPLNWPDKWTATTMDGLAINNNNNNNTKNKNKSKHNHN